MKPYNLVQRLRSNVAEIFRDSPNDLYYIHIGKCGGVSVAEALQRSENFGRVFRRIIPIHIRRPPIKKKSKYLIVIRNLISRAISAFNWRYRLVVSEKLQSNRFPGEFEILTQYNTLNNLAESLYLGGELDTTVAAQFRAIHHLKEDIAFYLEELLARVDKSQIFGVLVTEFLDEDINSLLGTGEVGRVHENHSKQSQSSLVLSQVAQKNLKLFLAKDYRAIETLLEMFPLDEIRRTELLK